MSRYFLEKKRSSPEADEARGEAEKEGSRKEKGSYSMIGRGRVGGAPAVRKGG